MSDNTEGNRTIKWPIIVSVILSVVLIVVSLYFTFTPETFGYLTSVIEYCLLGVVGSPTSNVK